MNKSREFFNTMVKGILKEEVQKRNFLKERVPEMNANGYDKNKVKTKPFGNSPNPKDSKTKIELLNNLTDIVHDINPDYRVAWDDHDDLKIDARDIMSFRITPEWEDRYKIEVMLRNEDRLWVTGLDWEQVIDFVKINLKDASKKPTYVDKAYDVNYRDYEEKDSPTDKDMPQPEKKKIKKVGEVKNKNLDYNKPDVEKEEDLPDKPLRPSPEPKKQSDYKPNTPPKAKKLKPDKKLTIKQ